MIATNKPRIPDLVDELFDAAFNKARDPRSAEYKAGVRALLELRVHGVDIIRPYPAGTAQLDAFWSGVDEGNAIWRGHKKQRTIGERQADVACDGA